MRSIGLTEELIQKGIVDCLESFGVATYHTRVSLGSDDGFPGVVGVRDDGAIVVVECTGPRGQLRDKQLEWIQRFRKSRDCLFAGIVGPEPSDKWWGYDQALERLQKVLQ